MHLWPYGSCLTPLGHGLLSLQAEVMVNFTCELCFYIVRLQQPFGLCTHDVAMALVLPHLADVWKWIQGFLWHSGDNKWFVPRGDPECNSVQEEFIFNEWRAKGARFQLFPQLQKGKLAQAG